MPLPPAYSVIKYWRCFQPILSRMDVLLKAASYGTVQIVVIMALDMPSELFCEYSLVSCIEVSLWHITDIKIKKKK